MAGARNGFAGCPCLPYSRMLASLALLPPSRLGSAKPTLTLWLPSRSVFAGVKPREASNSPVERESNFVPLAITEARLPCTFWRTTLPPASNTLSATASKLLPRWDIRSRNASGILISTFAIVVAISISFVFAQARKAHSFRCSSSPTKARIALVGSLSGHHFLRQHFDIHPPAFHILYRGDLKSAILAN